MCTTPQFKWAKKLPSTYSHVSAVKFNRAGSRALASLNSAPLLLFWIKTIDGTILNAFKDNNGGFNGIHNEGIRFTTGDDFVYLAMQSSNQRWALAKIDLVNDNTWNTAFFKDSTAPNSRAYSLTYGRGEGEIFVASSFTTTPGGVTTFHRGLVSLASGGNINWVDAGVVS